MTITGAENAIGGNLVVKSSSNGAGSVDVSGPNMNFMELISILGMQSNAEGMAEPSSEIDLTEDIVPIPTNDVIRSISFDLQENQINFSKAKVFQKLPNGPEAFNVIGNNQKFAIIQETDEVTDFSSLNLNSIYELAPLLTEIAKKLAPPDGNNSDYNVVNPNLEVKFGKQVISPEDRGLKFEGKSEENLLLSTVKPISKNYEKIIVDLSEVSLPLKDYKASSFHIVKFLVAPALTNKKEADLQETQFAKIQIDLSEEASEVRVDAQGYDTVEKIFVADEAFSNPKKTLKLTVDQSSFPIVMVDIKSKDPQFLNNISDGVEIDLTNEFPQKNALPVSVQYDAPIKDINHRIEVDREHVIVEAEAFQELSYGNFKSDADTDKKLSNTNFARLTVHQIDVSENVKQLVSPNQIINSDFSNKFIAKLEEISSGHFGLRELVDNLTKKMTEPVAPSIGLENIKPAVSNVLGITSSKIKPRLLLSTADVVGVRKASFSNDGRAYEVYSQFSNIFDKFDDFISIQRNELESSNNEVTRKTTELSKPLLYENSDMIDTSKLVKSDGVQLSNQPKHSVQNFNPAHNLTNVLDLYDVQFSSRLGVILAEKVLNGSESFEIYLEPESFGKVRVNVSLENSNVEVKMTAENSAAIVALRGSELLLQNITEQYGLRLSDYSVDMNNNQSGNNSGRPNEGQTDNEDSYEAQITNKELILNSEEEQNRLNLLA